VAKTFAELDRVLELLGANNPRESRGSTLRVARGVAEVVFRCPAALD
jgi:hypothetical protein